MPANPENPSSCSDFNVTVSVNVRMPQAAQPVQKDKDPPPPQEGGVGNWEIVSSGSPIGLWLVWRGSSLIQVEEWLFRSGPIGGNPVTDFHRTIPMTPSPTFAAFAPLGNPSLKVDSQDAGVRDSQARQIFNNWRINNMGELPSGAFVCTKYTNSGADFTP